MLTSRSLCVSALLLASAGSTVFAQTAPPPPTLRDTVQALTVPLASGPAGEAIGLATALEVANTPFGSSAGGFVFELDPTTGVRVRTAPTFGPAFAERALTAGAGKISFGASLSVATYDKLNTFDLKEMRLAASDGPLPENRETGFASFVLTSETLVVSAAIGATDKFDISVSVPFVKVKLDGLAWLVEDGRDIVARQPGFIESSGIGDVAIGGKYRLLRFGEGQPDPGGIAVQLLTRVPTGQRDNFRGLGITRVLGSLLFSSGRGRFRPHANVGFDWWEKALEVPVDFSEQTRVGARHQVQYALGTEFQAGPKLTLLADILGRHVLGGGVLEARDVPVPGLVNVTRLNLPIATTTAIRELTLAPGLKWNLAGSFVFSGNALISLSDNGLRDYFTPVIGVDWTF